jgi:cyclase
MQAVELGAGELLITSIDRDGTGNGYDLELTRKIAEAVPVPVIALGGAGKLEHVYEVIKEGRADAVSLASMLHYDFIHQYRVKEADYQVEGNIEFLRGRQGERGRQHIEVATVVQVKEYLTERGVKCRLQRG